MLNLNLYVAQILLIISALSFKQPVNEVYRNEKVWSYVDSPQNLIPIPRAPTPTFGQVVPKPQVWYKDDAFYEVLPTFSISVSGPSNYILKVSI